MLGTYVIPAILSAICGVVSAFYFVVSKTRAVFALVIVAAVASFPFGLENETGRWLFIINSITSVLFLFGTYWWLRRAKE